MITKTIFSLLIVSALSLTGCGERGKETAVPLAVAGLPPVAFLAGRIAGPEQTVKSVLPAGRSPHDFSPRPGDIRAITASGLFLHVGEIFERNIARSLADGRAAAVDVSKTIVRLPMTIGHESGHAHGARLPGAGESGGHEHGDHQAEHEHGPDCSCSSDGMDPHVWLSPANCVVIARNIAAALSEKKPEMKAEFERNLAELSAELEAADREMKEKLAPYAGRTFFVYHPAFGYLAAEVKLKQRGIELGGRDPSPARLAEVIREAREAVVKTIFVQPQFNPASGKALAEAVGGVTVELDPMAPDVIANFRLITEKLLEGFAGE